MIALYLFLGFMAGIATSLLFVLYLGRQLTLKDKEPKSSKEAMAMKMERVREIASEQLSLQEKIIGPQKNSLDGKYKNGLNSRLKELEEEKLVLLNSILEEGHDPTITTLDETGLPVTQKLSEFMLSMGALTPPKPKGKTKMKQLGKFTLVKGGKGDGTTH